ncbi:MiaB-like tRNA modifying enzyme, archaeal-type [Plasmodium fragile]|uniref:Threonylcarbamoyladenosine tRNA methylthiotransferase n=1 Tax=Plasmodium fragile TaxID=5857 RepID=A0A0D9QMI8_PLAFR|nr:MiaB-like tRNA modifying enzyme, archaeal-type [Plasmodium fragile]KJP88128.1 MiaB-like tRNA modifying enzyme, archaeal-type [Plasmodium fragile]
MNNKLKFLTLLCVATTGTYYICVHKKKEIKKLLNSMFVNGKKKKHRRRDRGRRKNNSGRKVKSLATLQSMESESEEDEIVHVNEDTSVISSENDSYFLDDREETPRGRNSLGGGHTNGGSTRREKASSEEEEDEEESTLTDVEDINNLNDRASYNVVQIKAKNRNRSKYLNGNSKKGTPKKKLPREEEDFQSQDNLNECAVILPEKYKIYFKSFGCAHNSSDSEFMMGLLGNYGFQFVKSVEECDICIINSCTVKNPSEESMKTIINYVHKLNKANRRRAIGQVGKKGKRRTNGKTDGGQQDPHEDYLTTSSSGISDFEQDNGHGKGDANCCADTACECAPAKGDSGLVKRAVTKQTEKDAIKGTAATAPRGDIKIIVCGCVPQAEKDMEIFENVSLVGVTNIDKIVDVVEHVINGYNVRYLKQAKKMTSLNLPKIRKNKYIEIININNGCLGNCTYCKTKFARGDLASYNIQDIINRIKHVCSEENIKEIWLTSEDTGAYGIDLNTNIVKLLKEILDTVSNSDVMIRLGMTNPPYILKHIKDICNLLKHKNMYEFIHIPVQSGSNRVLKNMNREYEIEDFIYLVENLRKDVPNITIATDIICGFPYETENDHMETVDLVKKYQFPILNISQFYPRRGTVAYGMKKINTKIVKKRSREVTDAFLSYTNNYKFLEGTTQRVLFTEVSTKSDDLIGHTKQYVKVLLQNRNNENAHLLSHFANCKIVSAHKWHVVAELA